MTPKHAITERLANLQSWRYGIETQMARIAEALRDTGFLTADSQRRIDELQSRVKRERVTLAFVAEISRGKSELINALFFSDIGRRLLPAGLGRTTCCVTELRFDRDIPTGIRLLPMETRENPRRFSDLYGDAGQWRSFGFSADDASSVARTLAALSETKRISLAEAVAWGLHGQGVGGSPGADGGSFVEVPRWRYAIINFPHPLLDAGLVIIDTPGLAALSAEPELARERMLQADALLLVLDAKAGVTKSDLAIWREHLGGSRNIRERDQDSDTQAQLVVLNKIDELQSVTDEGIEAASRGLLRELDKRVKDAADLMRIDPIRVVPVSAKQGLLGRLAGDADKILKSRLYQLERILVGNLPANRQDALTKEASSMLSTLVESAQSQLDQQRFQAVKGLSELGAVRAKNEKFIGALSLSATTTQARLDATFLELRGVKAIHGRLAEELVAIVDISKAKRDIELTRDAIAASVTPRGALESCSRYFELTEEKLGAIELKVSEIRTFFSSVRGKIRRDFDLGDAYAHEAHPFATHRFQAELSKAKEKAEAEFGKSSNLFVRRGSALADQFDEVIASRVLRIFEIASRESATWMRGLYANLEQPLIDLRERAEQRATSTEKVKAAELDLAERISELQAQIDVIKQKHSLLADTRQGLERFIGLHAHDNDTVSAGID